jgi:hypothetical protein
MLLLQQLKSYRWATNPSAIAASSKDNGKEKERSRRSPRHRPRSSGRTRSRSRSVSPSDDEDPRASAVRVADELLKPAFELQYRYKEKEKALAEAGFDPDGVPTRSQSPTRAKSPAAVVAPTASPSFSRLPVITTTALPIRSASPDMPLLSARPGSPEEKRQRAKAMLAESVEKFKAAARTVQQTFEVLQATEDEVLATEAANVAHQLSAVERETAAKLSGRVPLTSSRALLPSRCCAALTARMLTLGVYVGIGIRFVRRRE